MYSKFYGLSRKPFELTPDPDLIFLSETHQEALSVLLYGVYNRKGFLQISGNVGTGKSTLVQSLIQKLENNVHICHIPNPNFTVDEFYYYIGAKFGLDEFDGNKAKFILHLAEYLKQCREKDEFALLIIDEAQVLSLELLEEIRLLSNQEYTEFGVLNIFFVGQPELNVLLKHKKMDPLRNRIGIRFNLEPLTLDETVSYIKFRLQKAGRTVLLFSSKAMEKIHTASSGIPRSINILCDNALLAGFAEQRGIIDDNIIMDCVKELGQLDDSAAAESDTKQIEPISPEPVRKAIGQGKKKGKPSGLKKLAYVLVIISALFLAIFYSAEYWGGHPKVEPIKIWFEKFNLHEDIFKKIKELLISRKSETESSSAEKNMIPEKKIASSGKPGEQINTLKRPAVEKKVMAVQVIESLLPNNIGREIIETKENFTTIDQASGTSQEEAAAIEGSLGKIDASAESNEIRRNPAEISIVGITSQVLPAPGEKKLPVEDAAAEPKVIQISGEIKYVSISRQVGGANIRSGPSMKNSILRSVSPGYPLRVINEQDGWSKVEDFRNRKGWIASKLIIENSTAILKREKGYLRKGPSYLVDIVADIDYGVIVQVEEYQGHWLKVFKKNGNDGWIHKDMVWP